jgi:glycine betaine/proline transport system permease protein
MSIAAQTTDREGGLVGQFNDIPVLAQFAIVIATGLIIAFVADWTWLWPQDWVVPVKQWLSDFFAWLDKRATLGLFTVKELTRTVAWLMKQPLIWSEFLLWKSARVYQYMPVFWIGFSIVAGVLAARRYDGRVGTYVTLGILAVVSIDGFPYILESLSKALKTDPWIEPGSLIGISEMPGHILSWMGFREVKYIPWIAVVLGFGIFGHWVGGWRLASIVVLCMSYLAVTGLWRESMKTFSLVVVAVPFSALLGLWLGIWVTRSERAARIITPMFDIMQATPHLAYLVPVVVMFGAGQVPALIATMIFAMPPMARCTILAIQTVPSDVVESGHMSGCTPRQLLWKVQLPASEKTLLLGLNQVIMQTLAMVVICSLVGAQGLGHKLLFSLQQLKLGFATMQGVAIVLMAVVLDRLTQAYANKASMHVHHEQMSLWERHKHLVLFVGMMFVAILASFFIRDVQMLSNKNLLFTSKDALELDKVIKATTFAMIDYIKPIRDWLTVWVLIPMRDFYQSLPWIVVAGVLGLAGYRLGNRNLALLVVALLFCVIVMIGNWSFALTTFYFVFTAAIFCLLIGLPLGLWSARSDRVAKGVMLFCDTLQTFPSFIYLLPAIMLFRVGELAIIFAIIPYAMVPAIRYTYLGIKRIPPVTLEAARMNGATPWQQLWKVELPVALPEIMLGLNQTIMMALAMTAITALIGGQDLGQEIYRALPTSDAGRGVMAGLGIATLGIIADRLIGAWASERKKELGIA